MEDRLNRLFTHFKHIKTLVYRSFIKRQMSGTLSDNERQRVVQRVTTKDNKLQWMTTSCFLANFPCFWIREELSSF